MCGISGIVSFGDYKKDGVRRGVDSMVKHQRRRGPDGQGIWERKGDVPRVVFGHNRLAIIDLSEDGRQPMSFDKQQITNDQQQELTITFNGEIYNYKELKIGLGGKGYQFKTKTDTEVILALYAEYGEESFGMLRGMFAFGLWDEDKQSLYLVRDRYGIKPLYYGYDNANLVFASTVGAIEKSEVLSLTSDPNAQIGFLMFGSVPHPYTTYSEIRSLGAGQYGKWEDGKFSIYRYYDPTKFFDEEKAEGLEKASEKTKALFDDAVRSHLVSDAPLGVFLSGGTDSSAIAILAAQHQQEPLITVSVDFEEQKFSEKAYQDIIAKKIGSDHRRIVVTKKDFEESYGQIFEAMDQPSIDGVNTFFVSQAARKAGLSVVLSGLGGDEVFMGYPYFKKARNVHLMHRMPGVMKQVFGFGGMLGDKYGKLSYLQEGGVLGFYLALRGLFAPRDIARMLGISEKEVWNFLANMGTSDVLRNKDNFGTSDVRDIDPINLLSLLELKFYMHNQLLKDTDVMSMYHSLETRVPFLDHFLVEYVSGLSAEVKIEKGKLKSLLTKSLRGIVPDAIMDRPKMGFTFPFQKWLVRAPQSKVISHQSFVAKTHWSKRWALEVMGNKFSS